MTEKLPINCLFMHGLESGPKGLKVKWLKKIVSTVHTPDMRPLLKKSGNPWVLGMVGLFGACLPVSLYSAHRVYKGLTGGANVDISCWRPAAVNLMLSVVCCSVGLLYMSRRAAEHAVEGCIKLQLKAIEQFKPDLIVGSSFGGGIALLALSRGHFKLPTLVLAPAHHRICDRAHMDMVSKEDFGELGTSIECVHGSKDDIVPVEDSISLLEGLDGCLVHVVDDVHHLNNYLLENNAKHLRDHIQSVLQRYKSAIQKQSGSHS